jgi:hypothetical protein
LFDFFELTEIMRQKDGVEFAHLLNRLREGMHTKEDLTILANRKIENLSISLKDVQHFSHLFCTRADVNAHNLNILSSIPDKDKVNIEAIDSVSGNVSQALVESILSRIPLDPSKTMSLHKNLVLALGLPVELCLNIDTDDG